MIELTTQPLLILTLPAHLSWHKYDELAQNSVGNVKSVHLQFLAYMFGTRDMFKLLHEEWLTPRRLSFLLAPFSTTYSGKMEKKERSIGSCE